MGIEDILDNECFVEDYESMKDFMNVKGYVLGVVAKMAKDHTPQEISHAIAPFVWQLWTKKHGSKKAPELVQVQNIIYFTALKARG